MHHLTLTLPNLLAGREAEKSIENALRGFLLMADFSTVFSSWLPKKKLISNHN